MAAVPVDKLSKTEKDELCVSYAALMLHDDGLEINVSTLGQRNTQTSSLTLFYAFHRQRN